MLLNVKVNQDAVGVLTPSPLGIGTATISIDHNVFPKTAVIGFFGYNQASVTFDDMGTMGVSYALLNPMADAIVQQSIENIIQHMNENMLG